MAISSNYNVASKYRMLWQIGTRCCNKKVRGGSWVPSSTPWLCLSLAAGHQSSHRLPLDSPVSTNTNTAGLQNKEELRLTTIKMWLIAKNHGKRHGHSNIASREDNLHTVSREDNLHTASREDNLRINQGVISWCF